VQETDQPEPTPPKRPQRLKRRGKQLWDQLIQELDWEDCPEQLVLLEDACRTADLIDKLQVVVDAATDLRVTGSKDQPVTLPEIPELRQQRAVLASLLRALQLPAAEDDTASGSVRAFSKLGNAARWERRYGA
jgi:hypothetical protein